MITVRHFAAAAEAAGTTTQQVCAGSVAELRAALTVEHGAPMARVLAQAALLRAGRRLDPAEPLHPGDLVDVLPPFAGG